MPLIFFAAEKENISRSDVLQLTTIEFYEIIDYHLTKIENEYKSILENIND